MRKGSITIFLSLVLVLMSSFLFSLLEGARVHCLKGKAEMITELAMQSMFGNYHKGLWEDYHLLFLDGSWQEGDFSMEKFVQRAMVEVERNLVTPKGYLGNVTWNLTSLTPFNLQVDGYELATDGKGKVFQSQVAALMKQEATEDALKELLQIKEKGQSATEGASQKENRWELAWDAIDEAKEWKKDQEKEEQEQDQQEALPPPVTDVENPMDYVNGLKGFSVLTLVLQDPSNLSGKAYKDTDFIKSRHLQEGSKKSENKTDATDRLWLQYYIQNYFSNYTNSSKKGPEERMLSYEMEYLIGGKQSDGQNLEIVVYELLAIREAMNFITIMQDTEKTNLALGIASAAVGFTGIMPLVKAVQIGILLAWAFVESVLDVRALLEGKKIPFIKRPDQWSQKADFRGDIEKGIESKEDKEGLTYGQYLQMLLFLLPDETINYRCMDLIERNEQIRMDHMVQAVEGTCEYTAKPLFWSFNFLKKNEWTGIFLPVTTELSYGT